MTTKFQKKIFRNMSFIMVLFLIGLIAIFSYDSYQKLNESRKNNLLVLSSKTTDSFSSLIRDMDAIALHIASNTSIRDAFALAQKKRLTDSEIYKAIKNDFVFLLVPVDTSRFRINIYNKEGNFISAGIPYSNKKVKHFISEGAFKKYYSNIPITDSKTLSGFTSDPWSFSDVRYLSLYRELYSNTISKNRLALIDIQCRYQTVDSILSLVKSDTSTLLLNNNHELVYFSMTDSYRDPYEFLDSYKDNIPAFQNIVYEDHNNLITASPLFNGWNLVFIQPASASVQFMENYIFSIIITTLICLFSALFVVFLAIKYNTKPLQNLTHSVRELSLTSPYLNIDTSKYSDELVNLTDAFNQVVNKLTVSMEENAKARECEMRANLIALQSQMDPHFLYNMLAVINSYDNEEDFENIHQICIYMSSMLRYISSYMDNTATLEMELTHTKYYLQLMKFRFEGQFHYEIHVDSDFRLSEIQIPRLILQPILENCFQHGFKKVLPPWHISISFHTEGTNGWYIEIQDNGCGFSNEDQKILTKKIESFGNSPLHSIESLKIGGMGLVNTLVRIQYYLKNRFYYNITLLPEGGTRICLGGKSYDESYFDRR